MLKSSVFITSLVLVTIIFSCKVSRFVVYNFADINDYKKFIMNLEKLNVVELNAQESRKIEGGWSIFRFVLTGILDGIPNNTQSDFELFGLKIW